MPQRFSGKPLAYAALLAALNAAIAAPLFRLEYSAYTGSIEGTFIAIARVMAEHPGEWSWWPYWNGGMPFENAYLPLVQWLVAAFSVLTGLEAARSFHIVTAGFYVLGAPAVFWMALELSRRPGASLLAAAAYSCLSPSAMLVPAIGADVGGALHLRRLHNLVFYGEAPHVVALTLLPVAVACFSRAAATGAAKWRILAGAAAASVALCNAFGLAALAAALACWMLAWERRPWWKAPVETGAIGLLAFAWISPWLSPAMIRAIRANAATSGGDYRYTAGSWIALAAVAVGFLLVWRALRGRAPAHLRFFLLCGYLSGMVVLVWYVWGIAIVPQPSRYHLELDLALTAAAAFAAASAAVRLGRRAVLVGAVLAAAGLAAQTAHAAAYARGLIRAVDPAGLSEYKIAKWLGENRPGERAFVTGSASFLYNVFTDNPQLHGGHDQHTVNWFIPIAAFAIRTGMNAGDRDAEYALFWLKAFGVRSVAVSGEGSTEHYETYENPRKFEGVLEALWRDGGDTIYEVPSRTGSLAHVMPSGAVPWRRPVHGLDTGPVEAYVAALDDARYPPADFQWEGMSEARIQAKLEPGQVVAVQISYERGWEAFVDGKPRTVRGDAIGQMVIEPDCTGACRIRLRYTGGGERMATRAMSVAAMLAAAVLWSRSRGRRRRPAGGG